MFPLKFLLSASIVIIMGFQQMTLGKKQINAINKHIACAGIIKHLGDKTYVGINYIKVQNGSK